MERYWRILFRYEFDRTPIAPFLQVLDRLRMEWKKDSISNGMPGRFQERRFLSVIFSQPLVVRP